MPSLNVFVSDDTLARLQQEATDLDRKAEELAECAIEESVRLIRLRTEPIASAADIARWKEQGVANHVNGTCTSCDKPAADCWCVPF